MTTRGTKVLLSLLAVATLGFSMVNAYTFFVENRNPFGALNLTKLIIKASPDAQTGMELSNFKLQINTAGGQLNVHKICDENGEHCRDVDVLYTGTQGIQGPQGNTGAHVITGYVNGDDIVFGLSDGSTITLANVISQISNTGPQGDTGAQGDTGVSIVSGYINENDIVFELSNDSTITLAGIIQTITGPQGNTGANGTGIHHISTGYENGITTVEIYTDEHTIATTFQIRDGADGGTPTDIESIIRDILTQIRGDYRKPNALDQSGYVIGPTSNQTGLVWKTDGAGNPGWRPDETSSIKITPGAEQEICVQGVDTINCNTVALGKPENFVNNKYCIFDSNEQIVCNADGIEGESLNIVGSPDQRCKYQCVRQPSLSLTWKCDGDDSDVCNAAHTEYSNNLNCTDQTEDTNCIRYYLRIKDNVTRFTNVVYDDGDCSITCDQAEPTCQGQCEGGSTDVEGQHGKRCKYKCTKYKVEGLNGGEWQQNTFTNIQQLMLYVAEQLGYDESAYHPPINIERDGCNISCTESEPSGGGDSLWTEIAGTNIIEPVKSENVRVQPGRFQANPQNNIELYKNIPEFIVETSGIRMFGGLNFYRTDLATSKRVRGLSVNGPILAGRSGNYIYMFANGNSSGDVHRSYEILGENELAVGTRGGAFVYFTQRSGSYDDNEPGSGGGNPGGITRGTTLQDVYSCQETNNSKGNTTVGGTTTEGMGVVRGNDLNDPDKCSLNENVTVNVGHLRHNVNPTPIHVDEEDAYTSLMVGVNTDSPYATLDVNGSLRVGSNCLPIDLTCDATNVGTMMYLERKASYKGSLVICIADGVRPSGTKINYVWYDIMRGLKGTDLINDLGFQEEDGSCALPKPNGTVYPIPVPANLEVEK